MLLSYQSSLGPEVLSSGTEFLIVPKSRTKTYREAAPGTACQKPLLLHLEMTWLGNLISMPPGRLSGEVFGGMSHRQEAPGTTQYMLERLCLPAPLGTPWNPSGGVGRRDWGEGSLGFSAKAAAPATQPVDKR